MHSSIVRKKYQIFTPESTVREMLSLLRRHGDLLGKSFLENSCGDGRFLVEVVMLYVNDCLDRGRTWSEIVVGLCRDIVGYELDKQKLSRCRKNLDAQITRLGCPYKVQWDLRNEDFLHAKIKRSFDFIIGNPPYLSYWNIPASEREYIRGRYDTCKKGLWDYCFAFIERSLRLLNEDGQFCYIIPSSIFKTFAAQGIRTLLVDHLVRIEEYGSGQVFDGVLTSAAIILVDKQVNSKSVRYHNLQHGAGKSQLEVSRESLMKNGPWHFSDNRQKKCNRRFGDFFRVSSCVATLCNSAFVLKDWVRNGKYVECPTSDERVEFKVVRKAATPRGCHGEKVQYIIFPYRYDGESKKWMLLAEGHFRRRHPEAYRHLLGYQEKLLKRDADVSARWYGYGRAQALDSVSGDKLLLSQVITGSAHVYRLGDGDLPYSGYYVQSKGKMKLSMAEKILSGRAFASYAKRVGIAVNGASSRLTISDILAYSW